MTLSAENAGSVNANSGSSQYRLRERAGESWPSTRPLTQAVLTARYSVLSLCSLCGEPRRIQATSTFKRPAREPHKGSPP